MSRDRHQHAPVVLVREARRQDLESIGRLQAATPESSHWPPASYLLHRCLVAEEGNLITGFVVVRSVAPDEHEVLNLAVSPERRREGIGERLLQKALSGLPGVIYLEVRESNAEARKLYVKAGFTEVRVRPGYYSRPTESAIEMRFQSC